MKKLSAFWIILSLMCASFLSGCGGGSPITISGGTFTGLYRAPLTRGTSTITIWVDSKGVVEANVTDDGGVFPGFSGSGSVSVTKDVGSFSIDLTGTDGSTATAVGTFVAITGGYQLSLDLTGALGASALIASTGSTTADIYTGTWTGNYTYLYSNATTTTGSGRSTIALTVAADGQTVTGTGSATDENAKLAAISVRGKLDPAGFATLTFTYTYSSGGASVTVPYTGVVNVSEAGTVMVGALKGIWTDGITENDTFVLTKS